MPKQGFKLHVSATIVNAVSVAKQVVPYLLEKRVNFKIIKNLYVLADMNRGTHGFSQIGKFITSQVRMAIKYFIVNHLWDVFVY